MTFADSERASGSLKLAASGLKCQGSGLPGEELPEWVKVFESDSVACVVVGGVEIMTIRSKVWLHDHDRAVSMIKRALLDCGVSCA